MTLPDRSISTTGDAPSGVHSAGAHAESVPPERVQFALLNRVDSANFVNFAANPRLSEICA